MSCMFVLVLGLMCVADIEARVFANFEQCPDFFYNRRWPIITKRHPDDAMICQTYGDRPYFATYYLSQYRIPLFSAYRLDKFDCEGPTNPGEWFIEPQLYDQNYENGNMVGAKYMISDSSSKTFHDFEKEMRKTRVPYQALNEDYQFTNYDKGHLNPNFYQCGIARTATFTLTNAVPQDPSFNRQLWLNMERTAKQIMREKCNFLNAKRFFVTGVIPSSINIPFPEHKQENYLWRDYHVVNIPSGLWTAACCDASNANGEAESFSFSYYGRNGPYSNITPMPVSRLLNLLRLKVDANLQYIFHNNDNNNCWEGNMKSNEAIDRLVDAAEITNERSNNKMVADFSLFYQHL